MLIAQISDPHISIPGGRMDRAYATASHLQRAVAHLNALGPRPDVVLATGDLVDAGDVEEYRRLRALLAPLQMPVFLIPGNHDAREPLLAVFADHAYLPRDGGFLQYAVEDYPVRLLALDTLVPGESGGELCAERLAWLDTGLAEAPDRPTVVFMHHPPFRTGLNKMDEMGLAGGEDLARVIRRYGNVEAILCGHIHRPITRRFAGTVAIVCPGTAHQIALDLRGGKRLAAVMEPPACMLHQWQGPDGGLVSHLSYIGAGCPPFELFDGRRWKNAEPPFGER